TTFSSSCLSVFSARSLRFWSSLSSAPIITFSLPSVASAIDFLVDFGDFVFCQGAIHFHRTMSIHEPPKFTGVELPELLRRYPSAADGCLERLLYERLSAADPFPCFTSD